MIKEANAVFNKAEQIRVLMMEYNEALKDLITACDNKATAHQIAVQSSTIFKRQVEQVQGNIKFALEFVERDTVSQPLSVAGFKIIPYAYQIKQTAVVQITDDSDKAWSHILKTCADLNSKAIQKRLSVSAFTDDKTGHQLMEGCLGLVAIEPKSTTSITKQ